MEAVIEKRKTLVVDWKRALTLKNLSIYWLWKVKQRIFCKISAKDNPTLDELLAQKEGKKLHWKYSIYSKITRAMRKNNYKNNIFDLNKTPYMGELIEK